MSIQPLGITPPIYPCLQTMLCPNIWTPLASSFTICSCFYIFGSCKAIILTNLLCFVYCTLLEILNKYSVPLLHHLNLLLGNHDHDVGTILSLICFLTWEIALMVRIVMIDKL